MIKNSKLKGFSLVEVMVMFAVLSVILAASVNMITKKTLSAPQKISHGVYRCIALANGKYQQELYNGSKLVGSPQTVTSCSFKVPKAAMYKVDLYSAGSGGNASAKISSSINSSVPDDYKATYTLANINNSSANSNKSQLFQLEDRDFYNLLKGTFYVDSVYTGDAGFGGAISFTYPSVIDSTCIDGVTTANAEKFVVDKAKAEAEEAWAEEYEKWKEQIEKWKKLDAEIKYLQSLTMSDITRYDKIKNWQTNVPLSRNYISEGYKNTLSSQTRMAIRGVIPGQRNCLRDNGQRNCLCSYSESPLFKDSNFNFSKLYLADYPIVRLDNCVDEEGCYDTWDFYMYKNYRMAPYEPGYTTPPTGYITVVYNYEYLFKVIGTTMSTISDETFKKYVLKNKDYDNYYKNTRCDKNSTDFLCKAVVKQLTAWYMISTHYSDGYRWLNGENLVDDGKGADDEGGSMRSLAFHGKYTFPNAHYLFAVRDDDGANDSWSWGLNFKNLVDDIFNEAKRLAIEEMTTPPPKEPDPLDLSEIKTPNFVDLPDNEKFKSLYNNQSVLTPQAKQQMFDYCKLMFKPYYQAKNSYSNTDPTLSESETRFNRAVTRYGMKLGGKRVVMKVGGKEGLGKVSVLMYQLSGKNSGTTFRAYASNIKSTHKPLNCSSNDSTSCSSAPADFEHAFDANFSNKALNDENCSLPYKPNQDNDMYVRQMSDYYYVDKDKYSTYSSLRYPATFNIDNNGRRYPPVYNGNDASSTKRDNGTGAKVELCGFFLCTGSSMRTVRPYLLWQFPQYEGGAKKVINTVATGGGGPKIYVDLRPAKTYNRSDAAGCNFTNWQCEEPGKVFKNNVAYKVDASENPVDGRDTTFFTPSGDNYVIKALDENKIMNTIVTSLDQATAPRKQEPRLNTQSKIWSKTYQLGLPGKIGKMESSVENYLGDTCTFNVAKPGPVYRPDKDDLRVLNDALATTMVCKANNKVTFEKKIGGNGYNNGYASGTNQVNNNTYTWKKSINENGVWNVSLKDNPPQTNWKPTSMWARVFRDKILSSGNYDLKEQYNVGAAGAGTSLQDYCLARKGTFESYIDYLVTYGSVNIKRSRTITPPQCVYGEESNGANSPCNTGGLNDIHRYTTFKYYWPQLVVYNSYNNNQTDTHKVDSSVQIKYAPGKYKNFDCYGASSNSATTGSMNLYQNSPIVVNKVIKMKTGQGGGGAVVITW